MRVVINRCYGGFSLSKKAVKRLAELQGRKCYFFTHDFALKAKGLSGYVPTTEETTGRDLFWTAFDIQNPDEVMKGDWHSMTSEEKDAHNSLYGKHHLSNRPDDRSDPLMLQVIEELGDEANGGCAELKIVEIPDGTDYELDEYDGIEHIAEKHRTWS